MLNRNAICSGAYLESFDSLPKELLWTQQQIDASLAQTLAARPGQSSDVWVFAYGSLMWNPVSDFDSRRIESLHGGLRCFCLRLFRQAISRSVRSTSVFHFSSSRTDCLNLTT